MRIVGLVFVAGAACASGRPDYGGGEDDDVAADAASTVDDAAAAGDDAATVAVDAPSGTSCTSALEKIAEWQQPDGGRQAAPPAIAVGPAGEIVVAFNIDESPLVLATRDPNGMWPTTPLDMFAGSQPSMAFASDGTLRACWVRARPFERGPLVCASRPPGGAWSPLAVVDSNQCQQPSVALAHGSDLNVAYARVDGVGMASQSSGGGWSLAPMAVGTPHAAALAFDAQGREYVTWTVEEGDGSPALFERATGRVDGDFAWIMPRSLAVDGAGRVHVVFAHNNTAGVSYAYRDADNVWHFEHDIDGDGAIVPWSVALALGANGAVHVAYYARQLQLGGPNEVRLATRAPGGGWTTDVLHSSPDYWPRVIDLVARDGAVHVAFDSAIFGPPYFRSVYYARRCESADPL